MASVGMALQLLERGAELHVLLKANIHWDSPPLWQEFHREPWPSVLHTPVIQ